jgi:hypothetical protein
LLAKKSNRTDSKNPATVGHNVDPRTQAFELKRRGAPADLRQAIQAIMSPTQTSQVADIEPGQLLNELEQRQDDVLEQLDALDNQLQEVLRGLGVTLDDDLDEDLI